MSARTPSTAELHCGRALWPGETILWRGAPSWRGVGREILHLGWIVAYLGFVATLGIVEAALGHGSLAGTVLAVAGGLAVLSLLCGFAALIARSTRYVITSRRVILQYGFALPRSLSLPFRQIASLAVSVGAGGRGAIALRLSGDNRIPYLKLWPHARAWRLSRPEPMLRDVEAAGLVATRLSRLLASAEHRRAPEDGRAREIADAA